MAGDSMSPKLITILAIVLTMVVALCVAAYKTSRAGYKSAPYQVVRRDGRFELRYYPALTVVETSMARGGNGADNGFMRLFRFITGQNQAQQKIAMTTPVFMSGGESNATMAFVLPATMKSSQVPKPADGAVTVRELPPGRFAVLRFRGGRNPKNESEAVQQLRSWMTVQGLNAAAGPVYGYFDPPWTPSLLRRNEVMLRTDK
jgi:DNA gyrase inhibitor GyrI